MLPPGVSLRSLSLAGQDVLAMSSYVGLDCVCGPAVRVARNDARGWLPVRHARRSATVHLTSPTELPFHSGPPTFGK